MITVPADWTGMGMSMAEPVPSAVASIPPLAVSAMNEPASAVTLIDVSVFSMLDA